MKKKIFLFTPIFVTLILFSTQQISAQKWKEIIPLVSTCDDLKRAFKIKECDFPTTDFDTSEYGVIVSFTKNTNEWNAPKGTITGMLLILKEAIKLQDFETNFKDYEITIEGDVPSIQIYKNDKKGIRLTVQKIQGDFYITAISLYPTKERSRKMKRE